MYPLTSFIKNASSCSINHNWPSQETTISKHKTAQLSTHCHFLKSILLTFFYLCNICHENKRFQRSFFIGFPTFCLSLPFLGQCHPIFSSICILSSSALSLPLLNIILAPSTLIGQQSPVKEPYSFRLS